MAYRISATTEPDRVLLELIRDLAHERRQSVSRTIREAFLGKLYGGRDHWPKEFTK